MRDSPSHLLYNIYVVGRKRKGSKKMKTLKEDRKYLFSAYNKLNEARNELGQVIERTDQVWDLMDNLDNEINIVRDMLIKNSEELIKNA